MKRKWTMGVLALCILTQIGCVGVIPIPRMSSQVQSGRSICSDDVEFIVPGKTTRADVVEHLGPDFHALPQASALSYSWEMKQGKKMVWWWFVVFGEAAAGDAGIIEWDYWHAFFVAFDEHDCVAKTSFVHLSISGKNSLDEQLEEWARLPVAGSYLANNPNNSR